jgi:hypothetical protein
MKTAGAMKKLAGTVVVAFGLGCSLVEGARLPKATSMLDRKPEVHFHDYVRRTTKYSSSEWGSAVDRYLRPLPVHFHAYVTGRIGF